jgi:hypothetical protein
VRTRSYEFSPVGTAEGGLHRGLFSAVPAGLSCCNSCRHTIEGVSAIPIGSTAARITPA